ncbi:MAG TPA: hypothetical protein PLC04_03435 [Candidatus Kapabacteria bacterium]|jgi:outer membrane lipoprotein-sorting protein|nr:hypothetical protein [Candidatus Kapabacteria bacterium]HOV92116.1 hypothetical protein [Candidatus Kapabacteria bacterium]
MKRYITLLFSFLIIGNLAYAQTTEEFLQKYFEHTGLQKLDSVKAFEIEGTTDAVKMLVAFRLQFMKPNFYRMKERSNNDIVVYKIDNGKDNVVMLRDTTIPFPVFDNFIMKSIVDLLSGGIYNYQKNGINIEFQGTDTMRGNKYYKLELTDKIGLKFIAMLDTTTFDIKYLSGNPLSGPMQFSPIFLDNYRKVDGISFPFKIDFADRAMEILIRIDSIKLNPVLPKEIFTIDYPENKNFD